MKRKWAGGVAGGLLLGFSILFAGAEAVHASPIPPSAPLDALVVANNGFACELYRGLASGDGNLCFSPFSIFSALSMTYAGARENTALEMGEALRVSDLGDGIHGLYAQLFERLNTVAGQDGVQLCIGNSLWPHLDYPFLTDYLVLLGKNYHTSVMPVDFLRCAPATTEQINAWVEEATEGEIKGFLKDPFNPFTRLALLSVIYFKGRWEKPFPLEQTVRQSFVGFDGEKEVAMMHQQGRFPYMETEWVQMVELPYTGGDISMVAVLPKEPSAEAFAALESALSAEQVAGWKAELFAQDVVVQIPSFKMEWGTEPLKEALWALGIQDVFSASADLSGMDGEHDLCLDNVMHKACIEVNEEGAVASAATAAIVAKKSMMRPVVFRADHPFLFWIQDNQTGAILFMGKLLTP